MGLIVFSGTAFLQSPVSADYEILREFLPSLGPDFLPEGGTNYRAADRHRRSTPSASGSAADRYLIILSDGEATDDDWKGQVPDAHEEGNPRHRPRRRHGRAAAMIPDGAGGFMKDDNGAVVLSKLESGTLRDLATATHGVYRDASDWVDLPALLPPRSRPGARAASSSRTPSATSSATSGRSPRRSPASSRASGSSSPCSPKAAGDPPERGPPPEDPRARRPR